MLLSIIISIPRLIKYSKPIQWSSTSSNLIRYLTLLLITSSCQVTAQPPPPQYNQPVATIVIILVGVLFIVTGFFSVFLRHFLLRCLNSRATSAGGSDAQPGGSMHRGTRTRRGLDAETIKAFFPTFLYADVKMHRKGKGELECVVCLNEYEDHETLRLLPGCCHVFHPDCVDPWLASRASCPVCRASLEPVDYTSPPKSPTWELLFRFGSTGGGGGGCVQTQDGSEGEDVEVGHQRRSVEIVRQDDGYLIAQIRNTPEVRGRFAKGKLQRSHSTGHSILVLPVEDLERFTLRLPGSVHVVGEMGLVSPRTGYRHARASSVTAGKSGGGSRWGSRFAMTPPIGIGNHRLGSLERYGREGEDIESPGVAVKKSTINSGSTPEVEEDVGERSSDNLFGPRQSPSDRVNGLF